MNVEHIIWEDWYWTDKNVHGILELEVDWHGGGSSIIIMEGKYVHNNGQGKFVNAFVTIDEDTEGVSDITLRRIGKIVP